MNNIIFVVEDFNLCPLLNRTLRVVLGMTRCMHFNRQNKCCMCVWRCMIFDRWRFLLIACVIHSAVSFPQFQDLIPNGKMVPHPCSDGAWSAVGHANPEGGHQRNPFGNDFAATGMVSLSFWTGYCPEYFKRAGRLWLFFRLYKSP